MKTNRRTLRIKSSGQSDVKPHDRKADKSRSFIKAVILSLFLLMMVSVYIRWDSLMDLRNSTGNSKDADPSVDNPALRGKASQYAKDVAEMKSHYRKNKSPPDVNLVEGNGLSKHTSPFMSSAATTLPRNRAAAEDATLEEAKKSNHIEALTTTKEVGNTDRNSYILSNNKVTPKVASREASMIKQNGEISLLTTKATVTASVRGNLGPPGVVTSPAVADWLQDRWQAARDMSGTPIAGPHWLQLDLPGIALSLTRVLIDYEVALSRDYSVEIFCPDENKWLAAHDTRRSDPQLTSRHKKKLHIIHDISIKSDTICKGFTKIKLNIRSPASRFGTSIWRFEAYGVSWIPEE